MERKIYVGDSVYAEVEENRNLKLTTEDGIVVSNTIIMEPSVLDNLMRFLERHKKETSNG